MPEIATQTESAGKRYNDDDVGLSPALQSHRPERRRLRAPAPCAPKEPLDTQREDRGGDGDNRNAVIAAPGRGTGQRTEPSGTPIGHHRGFAAVPLRLAALAKLLRLVRGGDPKSIAAKPEVAATASNKHSHAIAPNYPAPALPGLGSQRRCADGRRAGRRRAAIAIVRRARLRRARTESVEHREAGGPNSQRPPRLEGAKTVPRLHARSSS